MHPHPGIYPESNAPQAWSASTIIFLVETMLGIVHLAPSHRLIVDPALPETRNASGKTEHEVIAAPDDLIIERPDRPRRRGVDALASLSRGEFSD